MIENILSFSSPAIQTVVKRVMIDDFHIGARFTPYTSKARPTHDLAFHLPGMRELVFRWGHSYHLRSSGLSPLLNRNEEERVNGLKIWLTKKKRRYGDVEVRFERVPIWRWYTLNRDGTVLNIKKEDWEWEFVP